MLATAHLSASTQTCAVIARVCTAYYIVNWIYLTYTEPGHQSTECPEPRSAEGVECKKCGETGHFARDCPTVPKLVCHNCGYVRLLPIWIILILDSEEGHKSGECPLPKDPAKAVCRNCDQGNCPNSSWSWHPLSLLVGHFTTDCPQKKDWSRVKCNRCGESMYHKPDVCLYWADNGVVGHTVKRCPMPDPDGQNADSAVDVEAGGVSLDLPATEATEGAWASAPSQDNWASAPATSAGDAW